MKEIGVYIHIPFCKNKCNYCDFLSFNCTETVISDYILALQAEIDLYYAMFKSLIVKSIYIGGGTPTYINYSHIQAVLQSLYRNINLKSNAETTIESNPGTIDKEKLSAYRKLGINRISMGLQSTDKDLLKSLGRIHDFDQFREGFLLARSLGFENISVDLMFSLPSQTLEVWQQTLSKVTQLKPTHISCYSLKIEEGTPFAKMYKEGMLALPEDESDREMYYNAINYLSSMGYNHYEISNFALEDKESVHNKIYWLNQEYIGLGLGAHSNIEEVRFSNTTDMNEYIGRISNKDKPIEHQEEISRGERIYESMILGLRLIEGLDCNAFKERYGCYPSEIYGKEIEQLIEKKLIVTKGNNLKLTLRGIDLSNYVFGYFYPKE